MTNPEHSDGGISRLPVLEKWGPKRRDALQAGGVGLLIIMSAAITQLIKGCVSETKKTEKVIDFSHSTEEKLDGLSRAIRRFSRLQPIHDGQNASRAKHCKDIILLLESALELHASMQGKESVMDASLLLLVQEKLEVLCAEQLVNGNIDAQEFVEGMDDTNVQKARMIIDHSKLFLERSGEKQPEEPKKKPSTPQRQEIVHDGPVMLA